MTHPRSARAVAAAALLVLLQTAGASAQQQGEKRDVDEMSLDALMERKLDDQLGTTSAVSKADEAVLSAPAAMTTISRDQIRHSGVRRIPDLLRWVPGVQVYRNAPGNYIVSLRGTGGMNGNNVVVLIDGVPINSPLDGSVDWDLVPVHVRDLDRIEVVRGPVSTMYGANAYTGVVNIVTRQAYGQSSSASGRLEGGADIGGAPMGGISGRYTAGGDVVRAGAFAMGELDATGNAKAEGEGEGSTARRAAAFTAIELAASRHNRLVLTLAGARSRRSSLDHLVQEDNPQTRSLVLGSARWRSEQVAPVLLSMDLWARNVAQFIETDAASYIGFSYARTRSNRTALGTDVNLGLAPALNLKLGGEGGADWVDAPYVNPSANDRLYYGYGFYGNLEYTLRDHLHFTLGGRGDVPAAHPTLRFSYRGSLVYTATDWAVRLAAASGYRSPSFVELGGRFLDRSSGLILLEGDPSLTAPTNDTLELGLIAAPLPTLHLLPTVYVSRLSDTIVEDFEPVVRRTFRNDPTPRDLLGAELEASWQARDDLSFVLSAGTLHWLRTDESVIATVGVPSQTSTWVAGMRVLGSWLNERLGYGLGVSYATSRSFSLRAGIPPRIIDRELSPQTHAFANVEYSLGASSPFWLSFHAFSAMPHAEAESPMPAASLNTTTGVLGLEYRED